MIVLLNRAELVAFEDLECGIMATLVWRGDARKACTWLQASSMSAWHMYEVTGIEGVVTFLGGLNDGSRSKLSFSARLGAVVQCKGTSTCFSVDDYSNTTPYLELYCRYCRFTASIYVVA